MDIQNYFVPFYLCRGWFLCRGYKSYKFLGTSQETLGANYVNLGVSGGTVFLAIMTFLASRDARRSIKAQETSVKVQETSVERMRDTLRPLIDMDVFYRQPGRGLFLLLRNAGVGPATIILFTGRNDINPNVFREPVTQWQADVEEKKPIMNMLLAPNESKVMHLGGNPQANTNDGTWVSSISVFYEDVYGRCFRTRVVYKLEQSINNGKSSVQVIGKEVFELAEMPLVPWKLDDIQDFRKPEGTSHPVVYHFSTTPLHFLKHVQKIKSRPITGTDFTDNQPVYIKDLTFDKINNGFPTWELQIGEHTAFKLYRIDNGADKPATFSLDPNLPFQNFGLVPTGSPDKDILSLSELYQYIFRAVGARELSAT